MSVQTRLAALLRSLLHRRRVESDIDDEIRFHLDARTADLIAGGTPPREAARQARLEFGATEVYKDGMRAALGIRWIDELLADLRYAVRLLQKSPGFTAIAVSSLALAIGANTAIFSVANEMLYARLAVPRAQELRELWAVAPDPSTIHGSWGNSTTENGQDRHDSFAFPVYKQLQDDRRSGVDIFAFKDLGPVNITANGVAQSAAAQLVSGTFFREMEVTPQLGRAILPSDDAVPGSCPVAVISDSFWHRVFGGSPSVLGRVITVNGQLITIVGVNPPGFTGAQSVQIAPALYLPLSMTAKLVSGFRQDLFHGTDLWWVNLMTRIRPGTSEATAGAALTATLNAAVLATTKPKPDEHVPAVALEDGSRGSSHSWTERELAKPLNVLLALSGLVLLLACANIANLMLARASVRQREMAVRLALGASRGRVLRQVLTESLLLAMLGGVFGILLGYLGRNALPRLMANSFDSTEIIIPFSWPIFAFTAAVTLLTGILFGILPAWRATRENPNQGLKEGARSASRRRSSWSGKGIVAFQIALSTLLVASSALFLRTLVNLNHVDPGFNPGSLLLFELSPPEARYPGTASVAFTQRLEAAIAAAPGVTGVTALNPPFISSSEWNNDFDIEGGTPVKFSKNDMSRYPWLMNVGPSFFPVTGIRILRGRGFNSGDTATSPAVSVINESLARKFFPNSDPIGRRFKDEEGEHGVKHFRTIVGICADTHYDSMRSVASPIHFDLYVSAKQFPSATYMVRSPRPPDALTADLRQIIHGIDPDLPMTHIRTQQQQIAANLQQERLFATLTLGFGLLALLLATVGIYGIMAYTVTQRTSEIGIRLALGAQRPQVRAMVLREAASLSLFGVFVGLATVLALVHIVKTMLYGLQPRDPASLAVTAVVLLTVAFPAAWLPALRASRVEPIEALRHE